MSHTTMLVFQGRPVSVHTGNRSRRLNSRCSAVATPVKTSFRSPVSNGQLSFVKYQGLGNDFILVDNRHNPELAVNPEQAKKLCDRNFGIGGDGVIFAVPSNDGTDFGMRIINSDGSEPEMCGNGIRCLARFIADVDSTSARKYRISTLAGVMVPELMPNGQVTVDMGPPILEGPKVPSTLAPTRGTTIVQQDLQVDGSTWQVTCVSMGNPHAVIYSRDGKPIKVDELDLARIGPMFELNKVFPARTNTEFVEVLSRSHVKMVVWERGAGRTLACGTGACALVTAGILEGRLDRNCRVDLPGGPLQIEWRESDNRIYMTGPADMVFSGAAKI